METQRFEKLMEYFKNEDSNIDFMVCMYVQTKHTHTHTQTQPNGLLIALQSLKHQTLLCKPEAAPVLCEAPGEHVSSLRDLNVSSVFVRVCKQLVQM